MKFTFGSRRVRFYLWMGAIYILLWLIDDAVNHPVNVGAKFVNNIWQTAFVTFLNFILFEYSIPFIMSKRKYILYNILWGVFIVWALLMFYSFGTYAWRSFGILLHIYTPLATYRSPAEGAAHTMGFAAGGIIFFGILLHLYNHYNLRQSAQQLQIEKQKAELNYLRSQTNPHFLFNTLNNIYSLARDKSELAPESILRLSKILRFMLYEAGGGFISIEQELKIISDYIALEKLRYDDTLRINFNYDVEDMKQALPPLLLIPMVENAFKHGVAETRKDPFVEIHLSVIKRQLVFEVRNSTEEAAGQGPVKENIGLSNLRRQLELLYKEYNLSLQQNELSFIATLKINLASHV